MPPSKNLPAKVTRASDDLTLRRLKRYLLHLEEGRLQHEACRMAELSPGTLRDWRQKNPQFREAESDAKAQGVERYERILADKALDGDYQSLAKFLEANDPDKYNRRVGREDKIAIVVVDATTALGRIQTLKEELERRERDIPLTAKNSNPWVNKRDEDIIDAEVIREGK